MAERTYRKGFDYPRASWPKKAKIGDGYNCPVCLCSFVPKRSDAVYCSGACRVAAHRYQKRWKAGYG